MSGERAGCGSRTTMGHGDNAICGQDHYGKVYECQSCQIKRLTNERDLARMQLGDYQVIHADLLIQALADQQMFEGADRESLSGDVDDVFLALKDMGYEFKGWTWAP